MSEWVHDETAVSDVGDPAGRLFFAEFPDRCMTTWIRPSL
jgi:hypothetical protein